MAVFNLDNFETYNAIPGLVLNSLADGSDDDSIVIDCGATEQPYWIALYFDFVLAAAGTGRLEIFSRWSKNASIGADQTNDQPAGFLVCNGTTAVWKAWLIPVESRYLILRGLNNGGAAAAASGCEGHYALIEQLST